MGRRRGEKKESKTRPSQTQKTTLQRPRPRGRMQGLEPVNIPGAPGHICKARRGVAENVPCDSSIRVSNDHITVSKCTASADALKSWEEMPAEGYLGVYCNRPENHPPADYVAARETRCCSPSTTRPVRTVRSST